MLIANAGAVVTEAGAVTGGGAAIGAAAGFLGWLLREPIRLLLGRYRRSDDEEEAERDRLGYYALVGGGIGGVSGFVLWLYEQQGVI
jgi:hypothetical protein